MWGFRSTTNYTYNNNHSNEFDRNYIALKCIVKYISLITTCIRYIPLHIICIL